MRFNEQHRTTNTSEEEDLLIDSQPEELVESNGRQSDSSDSQDWLREPVDKFSGVYILFYLLGMACLLPWNFYITANGYWMYKFRDLNSTSPHNSTLNSLQLGFTSYLCITSLVPSTVVLILNAFFGHKFSFKLRIAGGLFGVIVFFTLTTIMVEIDTDEWQLAFYLTTLISAVLINIVSSVFQGGICGLAGKFPSCYMNALISGQALGGIFASVANIISIALAANPVESAFIYFLAADITLVIALILYLVLCSSEFFVFYSTVQIPRPPSTDRLKSEVQEDEVYLVTPTVSYGRIVRQIWPYLLSIALVYVVTLSLFPSVAVLVQSTYRGHGYVWNDVYFTPVICFLLMNVGDYAGRAAAGILPLPNHCRIWSVTLSVLRLAFVPLMMLCNAHPRMHLPVLVSNDAGFTVVMAAFSLSSGYLSNLCFIMAPRSVASEEQETASSLMAASLGIGLAIGGTLSSALVWML